MKRNKLTNTQLLRKRGYHYGRLDMWNMSGARIIWYYHNKHGCKLHTEPLQQLQRLVATFGSSRRKYCLKHKRFIGNTRMYLGR